MHYDMEMLSVLMALGEGNPIVDSGPSLTKGQLCKNFMFSDKFYQSELLTK